jgi:RecB family endonuclease NucS
MPIEVGIWKLGKKVERIQFSPMPTEKKLEDIISEDISILDPNLLLIGRQVPTSYGKSIDLLARMQTVSLWLSN